MAGLWDIVVGDYVGGANRLNIHLVKTEIVAVALGIHTKPEARTFLETELGHSLTAAEINDLLAICANVETGTTQDKLVYVAKLEFALNAAELNLINETDFRSVLGI